VSKHLFDPHARSCKATFTTLPSTRLPRFPPMSLRRAEHTCTPTSAQAHRPHAACHPQLAQVRPPPRTKARKTSKANATRNRPTAYTNLQRGGSQGPAEPPNIPTNSPEDWRSSPKAPFLPLPPAKKKDKIIKNGRPVSLPTYEHTSLLHGTWAPSSTRLGSSLPPPCRCALRSLIYVQALTDLPQTFSSGLTWTPS